MKDGFLKVAAITTDVRVADIPFNADKIIEAIEEEAKEKTKIAVFPELGLSAYTCNDLFFQDIMGEVLERELKRILRHTVGKDMLCFIGFPFYHRAKLYNVAACIKDGKILALIPKTHIPNYNEFYEGRYFTSAGEVSYEEVRFLGDTIPFGSQILLHCQNFHNLCIGVEICEDLWVTSPPSIAHVQNGANVIVNLSASNELVAKAGYRRELVKTQSSRLIAAYIYADAGEGESSQDVVFSGHNIIAENGVVLAETKRFENQSLRSIIDINKIEVERRRLNTFIEKKDKAYQIIDFSFQCEEVKDIPFYRKLKKDIFIPDTERDDRLEEILQMQVAGLKKRLMHIGTKKVVLGISGGLDSTLALIVCVRTFEAMGLDKKGIHAITMPAFGTTDRTYQNAVQLTHLLGASLEEINIAESVLLHFRDIKHDMTVHDITYENAQARERTQILMDIANRENAIVIGTGDLSELALGWATYNGDHMSMYGINSSIPKTLIRHLVRYFAKHSPVRLQEVLEDILDTPVSPELLPPTEGQISQKTEDIVGPYELHDFFLYHILKYGFKPSKVYRLARLSFEEYDDQTIYHWLDNFYKRFFMQQFKRSCLPDGPKVGSIAISPRGDLRMPSDAVVRIWREDLERIQP